VGVVSSGRGGGVFLSEQSVQAALFCDLLASRLVAQFDTLAASQVSTRRKPVIKLGIRVNVSNRRIVRHLSGTFPRLAVWQTAALVLGSRGRYPLSSGLIHLMRISPGDHRPQPDHSQNRPDRQRLRRQGVCVTSKAWSASSDAFCDHHLAVRD